MIRNPFGALVRGISPRGFLLRSALVAAVFFVLHAAGCRDFTGFFSGGRTATGAAGDVQMGLGILYALSYYSFVALAPVLVLAAGILAVLERLSRRAGAKEAG